MGEKESKVRVVHDRPFDCFEEMMHGGRGGKERDWEGTTLYNVAFFASEQLAPYIWRRRTKICCLMQRMGM
jgi:hypothetical protein